MVGKHIFVRCRNEQNNAGTWTAAVTENIVDKDIIRNYIEPRCNMDETFAQNTLMSCPTNNVLRIYYVNGTTLVITRTYWVTDRITETQGRKGAYSVSYILTGEDVAKFCADYSGAFDTSCFENYDALVARTADNPYNRITIGEKENIFSHKQLESDASILKACGFTKTSFIEFMNGLYDAVEHKKQLAVILPKAIRDAWIENGDDTAEKLSHYILSLLPDFMRINVGMVSHWSCQIKDKMVGDMPLLFVHPKNEEDIAYLKREGAHILDLDTGRFTTEMPNISSSYFGFIWDNADAPEKCEEFWSYCKTNYKKLLRGRPTSAGAMECIYLIRETMTENYSDKTKCRRTLLLAANEFAGAGTRVPLAEEFISEAITSLGLEDTAAEKNIEDALRRLVTDDTEKTRHQLQEYKILLYSIEQGTASAETVTALCAEVLKQDRAAIPYYLAYLTDKQDSMQDKPSLQMTQFVSKLFITLFQNNNAPAAYDLIRLILQLVKNWTDTLIDNVPEWQTLVSPFIEAYVGYIKSDEADAECVKAVYDYLFLVFAKSDKEMREVCQKTLQKEEIRIYRKPNAALSNGQLRIVEYANAFLDSLYMFVNTGKDNFVAGYERLFRMIFNPLEAISEKAAGVYEEITSGLIEQSADNASKIFSVILSCEENALQDKPPIWNAKHTENMMVYVETLNLDILDTYYPSEERLALLVNHFKNDNSMIYPLFTLYTEKMPSVVRQAMYRTLQTGNMLDRFLVYVLLNTDKDNIRREIESVLNTSHSDMMRNVFTYHRIIPNNEETTERFLTWYENELKRELAAGTSDNPGGTFEKQYNFILSELGIYNNFASGSSLLIAEANRTFFEFVNDVFDRIPSAVIGKMQPNVINNILLIHSKSNPSKPLSNLTVFELVRQLDSLITSNNTPKLCSICQNHLNDAEMRGIIRDRLSMQIDANSCGSVLACQLYYTMSEMGPQGYPIERFLGRMGYDRLSDLDKGLLLVEAAYQLHNDRANIERDFGRKAMYYLEKIAVDNPTALLNYDFTSRWKQIKTFDYTRGSNFVRIMNREANDRNIKFDLTMLCFCVIGLIATSLIMALFSAVVIKLATVNTLISIIIASVLVIIVGLIDVLLFTDLLNIRNRRKNR